MIFIPISQSRKLRLAQIGYIAQNWCKKRIKIWIRLSLGCTHPSSSAWPASFSLLSVSHLSPIQESS